jgi:DNA repair exonuclease SbcCD ATPase subunit
MDSKMGEKIMRIIELRAENFRRLKAVAIRPDGNVVQITGANGQGKTSVLDAIWVALKGRAVAGSEPIRKGAEQAKIKVDLGELTIVRTFTQRGKDISLTTSLKVTMADGEERKSPQAVLDALIGDLSFDPLIFERAKPVEQFEMLKKFVSGFDFEGNSERRQKLYDNRTDLSRLAKRDRASEQNIVLPPGPKPQPADVAGKVEELRLAGVHNTNVANKEAMRDRLIATADTKRDEAERLRARAATLDNEADSVEAHAAAIDVGEPIDTACLSVEIGKAEATRGVIMLHEQREAFARAAAAHEATVKRLTENIEALDNEREAAIAAAKIPVSGLSLIEGMVLLNDLPFANASHAERLVTSTAIAMMLNPTLRVIRIYEGSRLDSASYKVVTDMAKERDYQVWIETVDESGEVGVVIEDGEVTAVDGDKDTDRRGVN